MNQPGRAPGRPLPWSRWDGGGGGDKRMDFSSASQVVQLGLADGLEVVRKDERKIKMVVPFTEEGKTGLRIGRGHVVTCRALFRACEL